MPIIYHNGQTGAPALSYSTTTDNIAHFTSFKAVLKACLVTGYGDQAAAGWTLVNEDTNFLVLRNGTESGYVGFTFYGNTAPYMTIYLAESYTGMSGNIMQGAGCKSGMGAANSLPHAHRMYYFSQSAANTSWVMLADSKTFALSASAVNTNASLLNVNGQRTLYVGEDSLGNFIAVGGSTNGGSQDLAVDKSISYSYATVLKDPATGLLIDTAAFDASSPTLFGSESPVTNTIKTLHHVDLYTAYWHAGTQQQGFLRGIAQVAQLKGTNYRSLAMQSLGRTSALLVSQLNQPVDLGDSYHYYAGAGGGTNTFFLVTNNPRFW